MIFFFAPSSIGWEERTGYCSTNASPNSFIRDNTFWRFPSVLRSAAISCQGRRGADGGSIGRKYPMLVGQTSAKVRLFSVNQFPLPWRECVIPRPIVGVMAIFQQPPNLLFTSRTEQKHQHEHVAPNLRANLVVFQRRFGHSFDLALR